jgi:fermentation-respiration switch protein FrsA (DUF1100 family)
MRTFLTLAVGAAAILVLAAAAAPWLAARLLFMPARLPAAPPPPAAGRAGQDVWYLADDGVRLHAWWYEAGPGLPVIVHLHGNAGHIGDRLDLATGLLPRGVTLMLASGRGYGRSEGRPALDGVARDAAAALRFAAVRAGGAHHVVLHGHSLGAVAAVLAAATSRPPPAGLILESPFTSLADVGRAVYPFLPRFVFARLDGRLDAAASIVAVTAPVMVVHGERDAIAPLGMGRALHDRAPRPAGWHPVAGAGHNDIARVEGPPYFDRLAAFARTVTAAARDAEPRNGDGSP